MINDGYTIIASATGNESNRALNVIRLTGSFDLLSFQGLFKKKLSLSQNRIIHTTHLVDGEDNVDHICFAYFHGPNTFTGENILELYVHGNTLNVERIISLFLKYPNIRQAKPGEFSYRAYRNGKMNLSQVEGLDLFIHAHTPMALQQGMSLLNGELQKSYQELFESFKRHKSALEILIDFSDDIGEEKGRKELLDSFDGFFNQIDKLKKRCDISSSGLLSPEIVIIGPPNAGKSTFFNLILNEDRAIVSPIPGTTRDYISENIKVRDVQYRILDTAGIRSTSDVVESMGIQSSLLKSKGAFFRILLLDPTSPKIDPHAYIADEAFDLIIFTHADHPNFNDSKLKLLENGDLKFSSELSVNLLGATLVLWDQISNLINKKYLSLVKDKPVLVSRQKNLILDTYSASLLYKQNLLTVSDVAILSHELNALGHCLSELVGIVSSDQVLDNVFSNFCIGK